VSCDVKRGSQNELSFLEKLVVPSDTIKELEPLSSESLRRMTDAWKSAEVKARKPAETPGRESGSWCEKLFEMSQDRDRLLHVEVRAEPSFEALPKLQAYLASVSGSPQLERRVKTSVQKFCYDSLVGSVRRFQKDWKFLTACGTFDPSPCNIHRLENDCEKHIDAIFDFIPWLQQMPNILKVTIKSEAMQFCRQRQYLPEYTGVPSMSHLSRSKKKKIDNTLPPSNPKKNIILWFRNLEEDERFRNFAQLALLILRILPTQVLCETSLSQSSTIKDAKSNRCKDESVVLSMLLGKVEGKLSEIDFGSYPLALAPVHVQLPGAR
jgi:hypothetical protein